MNSTLNQSTLLNHIQEIGKIDSLDMYFCLKLPRSYLSLDKAQKWIDEKMHGDMQWMENRKPINEYLEKYPWARSVIGFIYRYEDIPIPKEILNDKSRVIIARYAWGKDYHKILSKKLKKIQIELRKYNIKTVQKIDTAPILERDLFNQSNNRGFIGRNSMFIIPGIGSFTHLALLFTEIEIEADQDFDIQSNIKIPGKKCGGCRMCIDKCPTKAINEDGTIDARKCISYLTIEHKGDIPSIYHKAMGNRVFGCDICQEVCPYNSKAAPNHDIDWDRVAPKIEILEKMTELEFKEFFKGTPVIRTGYERFMRNLEIARSNSLTHKERSDHT